jgi:hypothetical protein
MQTRRARTRSRKVRQSPFYRRSTQPLGCGHGQPRRRNPAAGRPEKRPNWQLAPRRSSWIEGAYASGDLAQCASGTRRCPGPRRRRQSDRSSRLGELARLPVIELDQIFWRSRRSTATSGPVLAGPACGFPPGASAGAPRSWRALPPEPDLLPGAFSCPIQPGDIGS